MTQDLLGEHTVEFGGGLSSAGRPRLPARLMTSLLYLKHGGRGWARDGGRDGNRDSAGRRDGAAPDQDLIHRGKYKTLTALQRGWLKRSQAIEPLIGHPSATPRMDRCGLTGAIGDALHAQGCAAG